MLIRIRGGSSGIKDYLENGQKEGREYTRDQMDERVVLSGDLDLTDAVIGSMDKDGERYLHVTLAFKEDEVKPEMLKAITDEFESFAMTAYDSDEYSFYAEAHLPRLKSYVNQQTGEYVERKPHVHIVIPEQNLLSGKSLNPFGRVEHQTKFLEAFQEHINNKYGLASPKDNRRAEFANESAIISRYKGDYFKGANSDFKQNILNAILDGDVRDYEKFRSVVAGFGELKTRNQGKDNEYLNVKPECSTKGVNLKEYVFSKEFVSLPNDEKRAKLAEKVKQDYIENKDHRQTDKQITARLNEWKEVRARELKYINSGNRKVYATFRDSDQDGRREILNQRAAVFYARHREAEAQQSRSEQRYAPELDARTTGRGQDRERAPAAQAISGRRADSVTEQMAADQRERAAQAAGNSRAEFARIKQELDGSRLLASLSRTHGVIPEKYEVTRGRDGGDRIRCGTRNLNVSDFLTQEMRLPWGEAASILRSAHAAQVAQAPAQARAEVRRELWDAYRQSWPAQAQQKKRDWQEQRESEQRRRAEVRERYQAERRAIQNDRSKPATERKAALSVAAMSRVAADAALREQLAAERQALRDKHGRPNQERYRDWLTERANQGDAAALAELRRQRPPAQAAGPTINSIEGMPTTAKKRAGEIEQALAYSVDRNGNVTYYADQEKRRAVVIDTGRRVTVADVQDRQAVETGLRLAAQKFGPLLQIEGSEEFKRQVIDAAVKSGLRVEFDRPEMNAELERRRAEQTEATERGRAFIESQRRTAEAQQQQEAQARAAEAAQVQQQQRQAEPEPQQQEPDAEASRPRDRGMSR
jgi:hypothetical protein